jgi:hypothetical protein
MDKGEIITQVIIWCITTALSAFLGWIFGKKKSKDAVGRKGSIYLPLVEELENINTNGLSVLEKVNAKFINEMVINEFKYGLSKKELEKLSELKNLITNYNSINIVSAVHNILVSEFRLGFEEMYGSIIDGIVPQYDDEGNYIYDDEIEVPEYTFMHRCDWTEEIKKLISSGDCDDDFIDLPTGESIPINSTRTKIFNTALSATYDDGSEPKRKKQVEWVDSVGSYIAYITDFDKEIDSNETVTKKYEVRSKLIQMSKEIQTYYKDKIRKIVNKYEKEEL